jgi:D-arabinose 1-dehydrogenase-like Zn-dependent alcohol dehydrogenase
VFKIPDGIAPEAAAPMLCGGITLYSPLKNHGCGPGKKVGIIGVGGLGHFGVIFGNLPRLNFFVEVTLHALMFTNI